MKNLKKLSLAALLAALCLVGTLISIPLPTGYANLGDCLAFAAGFVLGGPWGIIAAALGSALADLILGWAIYMPATAILKGIIAVFGMIGAKAIYRESARPVLQRALLPVLSLAGEIIMVCGYFTYECFALGVGEASVASVPVNIGQGAVGVVASVTIAAAFMKIPALARLVSAKNDFIERK